MHRTAVRGAPGGCRRGVGTRRRRGCAAAGTGAVCALASALLCTATVSADSSHRVHVPADTAFVAAGVTVHPGDLLTIDATGSVHFLAGVSDAVSAPDGTPARDLGCGSATTYCGSLLARIATGAPFYVGRHFSQRVQAAGALQLGINDFEFSGTSGGFDVTVQVSAQAAPTGGAAAPVTPAAAPPVVPALFGSNGSSDGVLVVLILIAAGGALWYLHRRAGQGGQAS